MSQRSIRRRLVRRPVSLIEAMAARLPALPALGEAADGYLVTSVPLPGVGALLAAHPDLLPFVRQRYRRRYADLTGSYEAWLHGLSGRSRSTLKRKLKRFAQRSGGSVDLRRYTRPGDMAEFHRLARGISALSYQERRLSCGLPDGPEMRAHLHRLAERDAVRGWILFLDGAPVSYLYAPAEGDVLMYEHLGYDPAAADWSPGIVLQCAAMRQLFEERRFRLFDFTEGDGRHKALFATGDVPCADLLLLRPTTANRAARSIRRVKPTSSWPTSSTMPRTAGCTSTSPSCRFSKRSRTACRT